MIIRWETVGIEGSVVCHDDSAPRKQLLVKGVELLEEEM
jgi:hypothetical protein